MAIKMRRGNHANLDTTKLQGGEIAVTDNPNKVIVKTNNGNVIDLATQDDLQNVIANMGAVRVTDETLIFVSQGN